MAPYSRVIAKIIVPSKYIYYTGIILSIHYPKINYMQNWLKTLLAGYGAYKWGGGCLGSILVFVIIYYLLGYC